MYRVILGFADLEDNKHLYKIGDTYPRVGKSVSDERIAMLLSRKNLIGKQLIEEVAKENPVTRKRKSKNK